MGVLNPSLGAWKSCPGSQSQPHRARLLTHHPLCCVPWTLLELLQDGGWGAHPLLKPDHPQGEGRGMTGPREDLAFTESVPDTVLFPCKSHSPFGAGAGIRWR